MTSPRECQPETAGDDELLDGMATELIAHGEFSSTGSSWPNARIAAKSILDMYLRHIAVPADGAREALAQIDALISNRDRPTVNERNAFEHFTALNRLLLQIRDIARAPRPECGVQSAQVPDLLAATLSYSGKEITIQCNDFDVRDAIYDWLMHQASALPSAMRASEAPAAYCALCDLEHQLHEDAQGFHHVVKGARVGCPAPAGREAIMGNTSWCGHGMMASLCPTCSISSTHRGSGE